MGGPAPIRTYQITRWALGESTLLVSAWLYSGKSRRRKWEQVWCYLTEGLMEFGSKSRQRRGATF